MPMYPPPMDYGNYKKQFSRLSTQENQQKKKKKKKKGKKKKVTKKKA